MSWSNLAFSMPPKCDQLLLLGSVGNSVSGQLLFDGVEVNRRNNEIGQQQVGPLVLKKWIDLSSQGDAAKNYIGIATDGRIYQVIYWPGRVIARQLGGNKTFQELMIFGDKILVGIDTNLQIQIYSPGKWDKSPLNAIVNRGVAFWFGTTATAFTLLSFGLQDESLSIPIIGGFAALASGLTTTLAMANRYDAENTVTDGFIDSGQIYLGKSALRSQLSDLNLDKYISQNSFAAPDQSSLPPHMPDLSTESIR